MYPKVPLNVFREWGGRSPPMSCIKSAVFVEFFSLCSALGTKQRLKWRVKEKYARHLSSAYGAFLAGSVMSLLEVKLRS